MKRFSIPPLVFVAVFATLPCAAEESKPTPPLSHNAESFYGEWTVTHPSWRGEIRLQADGTFVAPFQGPNRGDDPGRWALASLQGTPLLVLLWDNWGTEALLMVTPDYFRGQVKPGSFMEMRRDSAKKKEMEAN